jgi:hypothetical protein
MRALLVVLAIIGACVFGIGWLVTELFEIAPGIMRVILLIGGIIALFYVVVIAAFGWMFFSGFMFNTSFGKRRK